MKQLRQYKELLKALTLPKRISSRGRREDKEYRVEEDGKMK